MLIDKRALDRIRLALDDAQKGAGGAIRPPTTLLPILQCIQFEAELRGELALRQTEPLADRRNINLGGNMRDKAVARASGIGKRLACTA